MPSCCVCMSVCLTFLYSVETSKCVFRIFHRRVATRSFSIPNPIAIFRCGPPNGIVEHSWGMKNITFLTSISLHHVLSTVQPSCVVNTVPPDCPKLMTLIGRVCVQHSNEACVTVLQWPFVVALCYA